ncbi:MAG: hypothetical protein MJY82_05715 [Fibrobacter sp.]|nr:hypothetical protein [Fibrobacter sp.]
MVLICLCCVWAKAFSLSPAEPSPVSPFAWSSVLNAYGAPGFGVAYGTLGKDVDESHYSAFANWEYRRYRGAFVYDYGELDSLYAVSRGYLESSLVWDYFGFGAGYALSMEWNPGGDFWTRHFFDVRALARFRSLLLAVDVGGFADEGPEPSAALFWTPSSSFCVMANWKQDYTVFGYSLCFSYVCVESRFRAPGFAVSLGASLNLDGWNLGGSRLMGGEDLDWNALWLVKTLKK